MGSTKFGNFDQFCHDATLPICNLLSNSHNQTGPWGGCELTGISLSGGRYLGNLGSIILCGIAILAAGALIALSGRRKAAVGRIEMQLFLAGYMLVSLCEIFTVGEFPLKDDVRVAFTGIHIGAIVATLWILMLNAAVGFQIIDDGTPTSIGIIMISAAFIFFGTGYIALDTGYHWSGFWDSSYSGSNRHIALYVLYQVVPLVFLVFFVILEGVLVIKILEEWRPLLWLTSAGVLFALGQIFNYTISSHICEGTSGKIDGSLFETFFTLLSVVSVWYFWTTITEDDWEGDITQYAA